MRSSSAIRDPGRRASSPGEWRAAGGRWRTPTSAQRGRSPATPLRPDGGKSPRPAVAKRFHRGGEAGISAANFDAQRFRNRHAEQFTERRGQRSADHSGDSGRLPWVAFPMYLPPSNRSAQFSKQQITIFCTSNKLRMYTPLERDASLYRVVYVQRLATSGMGG